jgi:uracil-DNA glycosylase
MTSAARKRTEPAESAAAFLPARRTLPTLAAAAASCKGCELYKHATQTVFGEGPRRARVVMVGEEPGNDEDLQGHVFVGPAGRVLSESLEAAGIDRDSVYLTNAVKHFKWEPKGKRRLHKKPTQREIWACKPWLEAELAVLKPEAVVCLGATAAASLLGNKVRVTQQRGQLLAAELAPIVMVTVHPASLLRAPTPEERAQARKDFVRDLKRLGKALKDAAA